MKVKITVEVDMTTGEYELKVNNLTKPGSPIELTAVKKALGKIGNHLGSTPVIEPKALLN